MPLLGFVGSLNAVPHIVPPGVLLAHLNGSGDPGAYLSNISWLGNTWAVVTRHLDGTWQISTGFPKTSINRFPYGYNAEPDHPPP